MNNNIPKQFIPIAGKPLLFFTINAFYRYSKSLNIILVLPAVQIAYWKKLCKEHSFTVPHIIAKGGETRFDSVKNGLKAIKGKGLIAVHDGVRPFVSTETITNAFDAAEKYGAAIPVIAVNDSLRKLNKQSNKAVARNTYRIVQTPQCFRSEILLKAYQQKYNEAFTDDASVVERTGEKIFLVDGNPENIKITSPADLVFAECLTKQIKA
jgi:2-C-methyl-D-erythritol 4-phosphate cytidylyltransferase